MGRRSRQRSAIDDTVGDAAPPVPPRPAALRRKARSDERPPAPWGDFPLGEITTLAGIVVLVAGFVTSSVQLIAVGFALVALSATELAAREHFAGFRSHSALLALILAVATAVVLVLLLALRSLRRALVPLVPIVLATGWSGLLLFLTRIPLNPMSVTLGALVIAISTEFSVLLSERYRQERTDGRAPEDALARTYASTGRAVAASGATAIAGFAVLVVSDISMLRDFGLVTVLDLSVSLLGVLAVLPAALLLEDRRRRA